MTIDFDTAKTFFANRQHFYFKNFVEKKNQFNADCACKNYEFVGIFKMSVY